MQLAKLTTIRLTPTEPFYFDSTFHKPDHFATDNHHWQTGIHWQTWRQGKQRFGLKFENMGSNEKPSVAVTIFGIPGETDDNTVASLVPEIRYRYNLDLDLTDFYRRFGSDPTLGPVINRWRGLRPGHPSSLYEYIIIGIMLQNTVVRRSIAMLQALFEHYGDLLEFDGMRLWSFWEPGSLATATEDELRTLKLGYRAKSVKRVDDYFGNRLLNEQYLRDKDVAVQKQALLNIYGVGPATVWYLLFDVFHNWDSFDHVSPWEQKIYSKLFFDRDPEDPVPVERLLKRLEEFAPYRHLAMHYIWEDLWWRRKSESIPWLEKLVRV